MTERDWSDDDARLVAFLDGQLSKTDRQALEIDLERDPELRTRLDRLDVDLSDLAAEMDGVLSHAPAPIQGASSRGSVVSLASAASVALALLFGGWLLGRQSETDDWRDFAAAYHLLYRTETLAGERVGDGGIATVSAVLGHDLSPLAEVSGLTFRRAQVLGWQDRALIQLAYLDDDGRPFAICIIKASADSASIEAAERHGLPTGSFHRGGLQVMVIGAADTGDVGGLTREVSRLF